MNRLHASLLCLLLAFVAVPACAQERPYTDGPVIIVSAVKVMDGQFENYMAFLNGTWRPMMQASKDAGIVSDFHVYGAQAHNPNEADLYLVTTYPNMAAFDDIDAKMDPIMAKVTKMNYKQADEASGKRTVMRTLLGEEMLRELVFK
jgi:hypothetical protein